MFGSGSNLLPAPSSQGLPSASLVIQASIATLAPPTPPFVPIQEVSVSSPNMVIAPISLAAPIMAPLSTVVTPLKEKKRERS